MIHDQARFINMMFESDIIDNSLQEIEDIEEMMIYNSLSCEIYKYKD